MAVTLEQFFTHPAAFGVTTASPCQRGVCRIADGRPLEELADDEDVVRMVGGREALPALPTIPPTELYVIGAIRSGKSKLSAAIALDVALTIDLSRLQRQEVARIAIVSVSMDNAKVVLDFIVEALSHEDSRLKRYMVHETRQRVLVQRDDGRLVEIVIKAGSVSGRSLVSKWTVCCIFDEAARMLGKADGAVNFEDLRAAVIARLRLIGGRLIVVSSPWAARGPIFEAVQEGFGKPTRDRVILRATGPMLCPVNWTPEACEREKLDPRGSYETDVLGQFVDPEAGFLTAAQVGAATRGGPVELPREQGWTYTAAMDPATTGNAWTLVVVAHRAGETEEQDEFRVALARQWQGSRTQPLLARDVFAEMAPILKGYGIWEVHTDRWGGTLLAEHGDYAGITVTMNRDTSEERVQAHQNFRTRLLHGRVELAPVEALRADLVMVRKKLQPGGAIRFDYPVTRDGRHADFAPAAVLAVARAAGTPGWVNAMAQLRLRGGLL